MVVHALKVTFRLNINELEKMRVIPTEMCIFLLDKGEKFSKFAVVLYLELSYGEFKEN